MVNNESQIVPENLSSKITFFYNFSLKFFCNVC